jgi:hypothetical protein
MKNINHLKHLFILTFLLIRALISFAETPIDTCKSISTNIILTGQTVILNLKAKANLDSMCRMIKNNPLCKLRVESHGYANEADQQTSWDKLEAVRLYLRQKGVDKKRLVLSYGVEGDPDNVAVTTTTEEGPYWIPAPIPCYSLHLPRKKRCVDKHGHFIHG